MVNYEYEFLEAPNVNMFLSETGEKTLLHGRRDSDLVLDASNLNVDIPESAWSDAKSINGTIKGYTESGEDYGIAFFSDDDWLQEHLDRGNLIMNSRDPQDVEVIAKLLRFRQFDDGYPVFRCYWQSLLIEENGNYYLHVMSATNRSGALNNPLYGKREIAPLSQDLYDHLKNQIDMEEAEDRGGEGETVYEPVNGTVEFEAAIMNASGRRGIFIINVSAAGGDGFQIALGPSNTQYMPLFKNILHTTVEGNNQPDKNPLPM